MASRPQRPVVQSGNQSGLTSDYGPNESYMLHDLAFIGFELWAHTYDGSSGATGLQISMPTTNLLIEDLKINGYGTNMVLQGRANSAGSGIRNLRVRRCVVVDAFCNAAHSQGAFVVWCLRWDLRGERVRPQRVEGRRGSRNDL